MLKYGETADGIAKEVAYYDGASFKRLEMEEQARVRDLVRRGFLTVGKSAKKPL